MNPQVPHQLESDEESNSSSSSSSDTGNDEDQLTSERNVLIKEYVDPSYKKHHHHHHHDYDDEEAMLGEEKDENDDSDDQNEEEEEEEEEEEKESKAKVSTVYLTKRSRWLASMGAWVVNYTCLGILYSFSIIGEAMSREFGLDYFTTTWVQSLVSFMLLFFSPLAGYLYEEWSARITCIIGTGLTTIGMLCSSFSPNLGLVIFLFGGVGGLGNSLSYVTACVVPVEAFPARPGIVSAVALSGGSISAFTLPPLISMAVDHLGWRNALRIYAVFFGIVTTIASFTFSDQKSDHVTQTTNVWSRFQEWKSTIYEAVYTRHFISIFPTRSC
jgi:predicted MFS family arabinose efflux permease